MSKRKLLLADDSVTIQKVVNLTFADEGIEVITVADGDSAIERVTEVRPDLVLADVHMPGLNGYQVCELLRENEDTRELPVLLLVGSFEPFDEGEAERVGANGYMTKPFQSIRQLVSRVTELIESSTTSSAETAEETNDRGPITDTDNSIDNGGVGSTERIDGILDDPGLDNTDDIEGLYKESIGDPGQIALSGASSNYVDAGMDDEMIEAQYSEDLGSSVPSFPGDPEPGESGFGQEIEVDHSHNAPPAVDEFSDTARMNADAEDGRSVEFNNHLTEESSPFEEQVPEQFQDDRESIRQVDGHRNESPQSVTAEPERNFEFDDLNLLELPPVGPTQTVEIVSPQESVLASGAKQVVTLSPDLIDMIAQRVIEKLSEKKGS